MSITFQIITGERVYAFSRRAFSRREVNYEMTIKIAHNLLRGKAEDATFDVLHKGIAQEWLLRDDVVKPFGDRLETLKFVCSFDLDQDILIYADSNGHIQLPLARLRISDSKLVQRNEFTPFEVPLPPQFDIAGFPPPYHKSLKTIPDRCFAFTSRVISDFATQWCHILRSYYADTTFRRLSKAIISIATYDFEVVEISDLRRTLVHRGRRGAYIRVVDVPSWEPYWNYVFSIGGTIVILDQDLRNALEIAVDDSKERAKAIGVNGPKAKITYLLLSIRHVMLGQVDSSGHFSYNAPMAFMDGSSSPSPEATLLLLQAPSPALLPAPCTPVHGLLLEIQGRILEYVSEGSVEAARLGCLLGLGSPFKWQRRVDWGRRVGPLELFTSPSHRGEATPFESKIYFGDTFSGVSYR